MKTLLFILLSTSCMAAGPKYNFTDPKLNDELQNVYFDIRNVLNGSTVTIRNLSVSSITVTGGSSFGKVKQIVFRGAASQTSTTSTSYVDTALTQSFTPRSATNRIAVMAFGTVTAPSDGNNTFSTIAKDGTNLLASEGGCWTVYGAGGSTIRAGCTLGVDESASNTTARTYAVRIKVGGGTGYWAEGSSSSGMIIMEYEP